MAELTKEQIASLDTINVIELPDKKMYRLESMSSKGDPLITQTIKSGDTEHAPSADALYKVIGAVYPEWWGAVGDGETDDSDAIQAAIDNAGHIPVVLTSQKGYLVKKTINLIEPFGKEEINSQFDYTNENGSAYNCYQTLIVKHDIIGDESLAGPVIRTGSNMNRIEVHGAIVVRNSSDNAVGISCAGTQYKYKPYEPTSGPDNINTGDLGVMQDIKINAIIKGHDGFPYYDASDSAATEYGLGKGTAVLYGGGNGSVLDVRHIYGFENGVWITFANGCKIDIGECACLNDIRIDGTVNTWGGGVTRNKIRLDTHNLNKNWNWVKNAHNNNKDISIIYIASNASVNYSNVECSNNEISVGGNNDVNWYCTYNYIVNKVGNSSFTGNKITVSNTLVGSKVEGNWLPVRINADSFDKKVNNGNRICNDITFDYDTISINYALNTECSPVIIDGNTHSSCYRGFNSTEEETTRFLLDKVAYTYIKGTTVLDDNSEELVKGASKVLFPHYSQLYKCHVVDSVDTTKASTYSKGHLYILKNSTLTDSPQYHAAYGWHNNKFELLGYYVDTLDALYKVIGNVETVTVTPSADTEYTLNSNKYLRIIPADAVKLTFNKSDNAGLMCDYHILIDCSTAVPIAKFKGVLWGLDNEPVFEKYKIYDISIRDDGTNLYGNWKAYKLMAILITTSDASGVRINDKYYQLTAGDNLLTDVDLNNITSILGFNQPTDRGKFTSIDFGGATIKIESLYMMFQSMNNLTKISNITIKDAVNFGNLFANDTSLKEIDSSKWDVSKATSFVNMFNGCSSLTSLDVSGWNTSKATNFINMFNGCRRLTSLDVSGWNTSSVIDFGSMFNGCSGLTSLNVSGWDVSGGNKFNDMFNGCRGLTSLNVSGWDVSSVTDFSEMFNGCSGLTSLNVSKWIPISVIDFGAMFKDCCSLTSLDVSRWNTSSATDFSEMFSGCSSLTSLDVSDWNVSGGNKFNDMFSDCRSLTSLDVSKWNTSSATLLYNMFNGCSSLTSLDVSGWNTSSVTDFYGMFFDCRRLTSLDVSKWNTSSATLLYNMFSNCSGLTSLDLANWNTSSVTDFSEMFSGCSSLTSLDVSDWNVSGGNKFNDMFSDCRSLTSLDVSKWNTSSATLLYSMFSNCSGLTSLDLANWNTSSVTDFSEMFSGCSSLTSLDVSRWNTSSATLLYNMFNGCSSLTSLDVSGWNTSSVIDFSCMFSNCSGLTSLDLANWNTSSATLLYNMFSGCSSLTSLDVSDWNVSTTAEITDMFRDCNSLTTIKMIGCSQETIDKIKSVKPASATIVTK